MFGIFDDLPIVGDLVKDLAGNLFAEERQTDSQAFNSAEAAVARDFNANEAQKQRDFDAYQSNSAVWRRTEDLKHAGLNPLLAIAGGGAATPGGGSHATASPATSPIANPNSGHSFSAGMATASQIDLNRAAEEKTKADAERSKAEADEIRARTPTHAINIQQTLQNIEESKNRVTKILAEIPLIHQQADTSAAQSAHLYQQIENLQEQLPKIKAEIAKLKTSAALDVQHARESMAGSDLKDAQHDEIRNALKQNLPEVERLLKDLELKHLRLTTHGRGMDAAASANIVGAWRATIRAMTGQQPITHGK